MHTYISMSNKSKNPFAILAMDSDSDSDTHHAPVPVAPSSPPFRVWQQPESRFRGDNAAVFSSPFKKTHAPKKNEGWVSIRDQRWNQPQFEDDLEPLDTLTPKEETKEIVVMSKQESMTAVAWAERIKKSLEKAETARAEKAKRVDPEEFKEALGRLSFFRRPLVSDKEV